MSKDSAGFINIVWKRKHTVGKLGLLLTQETPTQVRTRRERKASHWTRKTDSLDGRDHCRPHAIGRA